MKPTMMKGSRRATDKPITLGKNVTLEEESRVADDCEAIKMVDAVENKRETCRIMSTSSASACSMSSDLRSWNNSNTDVKKDLRAEENSIDMDDQSSSVFEDYDGDMSSELNHRHGDASSETSSRHTEEHCGWSRQIEYILACCGFVTSVETLLYFPHAAAIYGGGVFLVVYLVLTLTCGFPLLYMEMILGQYARGCCITAWGVLPLFKGLGVCMVVITSVISLYYSVTVSWALYYLILSLQTSMPWYCKNNTETLNCENRTTADESFLSKTDNLNISSNSSGFSNSFPVPEEYKYFYVQILNISSGVESPGHLQWYLLLSLMTVWLLVLLTLLFGPRSLGKIFYFSYLAMQFVAVSILIRCCMEDGAIDGIKYFLNMKWNVLGNLEVWKDAGKLMFVSLGLGTGCLTSLAGYTHFHSHCFRNAAITITAHLIGQIISGFTMFAVLGTYGHMISSPIENLNFTAVDLGFTLVPSALGKIGKPQVWCVLFYLLVLLIGLDTQCIYVQNLVSALLHLLKDRWRFRWKYKFVVLLGVAITMFTISLLFTTQGGIFLHHFFRNSLFKLSVYLVVLTECLALAWIYGAQRLWNNVADMTGSTDSPWWKLTWRFLTPVVIVVLIILNILLDKTLTYRTYTYPEWSTLIGWLLTLVTMVPLLVVMVVVLLKQNGSLKQRFKTCLKTPNHWGPGPLANQEPGNDLPDYVICTPDFYKPENALAILTANLYIPNISNLVTVQDTDEPGDMTNGYLSDLMTVDSGDSSDDEDENSYRGNWSSRLDFVLSCLGYVVGLGNVWRFPYLVYKNGGGAFFIPYLIMLVFCGIPLVYMELAFGQYASLGPVTVWRAVPIFKGIGISMVLATTIISIYYNMVNAWAFHYLFSSMVGTLPWLKCGNGWNNPETCSENKYQLTNCSWLNTSFLLHPQFLNNSCSSLLYNCTEGQLVSNVGSCINDLRDEFGTSIFLNEEWVNSLKLTSPSEEYFYNKVLNESGGIDKLGHVQWELALCLLLCWIIVFVCLVRGIKTSGKVAYFVVTFPFLIILVLLIRAFTMDGNMQGIKFYVTPKWEKLKEPGVWADAAVQVFFSLSACMGGLTTLASYNKFHNNIYSDALLVCLGDTVMSVLSGFSVFALMGVLSTELDTDIDKVITSGIGLTFIVNPAAMSYLPIAPLWSILFFLMIIMLGLSTQFVNIETVITAIIDENIHVLRKRRVLVLFVVCTVLFLLGLPLTTQGGIHVLRLMDEYVAGFPIMINGIFICIAIGWVYGIQQFCSDITHMIGQSVGYWWKAMWCVISPIIITFIIVFSVIGYEPLSVKYGAELYPDWSEAIGFTLAAIPVMCIPFWIITKLVLGDGSLLQRIKKLCRSESNWGPALERNWKNVEYYPAVNTNTLSVDIEQSPLHTVTDHVDFTTVGVRVPSLSSQTSLLPKSLSPKKPRDMRERAILNHAYSNPQCHQSTGSIEKSVSCGSQDPIMPEKQEDPLMAESDILIVQKCPKVSVETRDATTQTEPSHIRKTSKKKLDRATSPKKSTSSQATSTWSEDCPAVLEVEVTHF